MTISRDQSVPEEAFTVHCSSREFLGGSQNSSSPEILPRSQQIQNKIPRGTLGPSLRTAHADYTRLQSETHSLHSSPPAAGQLSPSTLREASTTGN